MPFSHGSKFHSLSATLDKTFLPAGFCLYLEKRNSPRLGAGGNRTGLLNSVGILAGVLLGADWDAGVQDVAEG